MKILICGSRSWSNKKLLQDVLDILLEELGEFTVIHGNARGADIMGGDYASHSLELITIAVPAKWKEQGRRAGPLRNTRMLREGKPSLVVAFHNDLANSLGTGDMVRQAKAAKVPVILVTDDSTKEEIRDAIRNQRSTGC